MPSRRRLIVVSNRGPVSFSRGREGERVAERGAGGLVTALRGLIDHLDVTWIASAMSDEDRAVASEAGDEPIEEESRDGSSYRLRLVEHDPAAFHRFYTVAANPTLWFLQHNLWGLASAPVLEEGFHRAWDEGYAVVNRAFADAVISELGRTPDADVFFHDYHLYLAPTHVRAACPDAVLAHFVHIPWPQSEAWTVLPERMRRAVHEGLLANDVVGFHTERWARNFLWSSERVVDAEVDWDASEARLADRATFVRHAPISVDPDEFATAAASEAVREREAALAEERPEQLILRVDRTDPSKNVVRGFRAFELLLEAHPELCGRVGMLAHLDPSRQDIPEYAEYLAAIERSARVVNDRFELPRWKPIQLRVSDDFAGSVAAYKQFDVLLVNAVFDGLNLVAKEAPLVNEREGVLVLSENAGVHEELGEWALTVNPFDVAGQARALYEALMLDPDERRRRLEGIRAWVREHDIAAWSRAQLGALDEARRRAESTLEGP